MEKVYTYYQEIKSKAHMLYVEEIAASITEKYFPELGRYDSIKETRKQLQRIEKKHNMPKMFYNTKSSMKRVYSPEVVSELIAYFKLREK